MRRAWQGGWARVGHVGLGRGEEQLRCWQAVVYGPYVCVWPTAGQASQAGCCAGSLPGLHDARYEMRKCDKCEIRAGLTRQMR